MYQPQHTDQPSFYPQPPTPPKRHRVRNWALGVLGGIAAVVVLGVALGGSDAGKTAAGRALPVVSPSTTVNPPTPAAASPTTPAADPGPTYVKVNSHNIRVTLKVLTKDCFGSAGCNVTYRPQITQTVPAGSFDPSTTWDVTYEVRGGSDGAQTGTLYVTGDSYRGPDMDLAQTDGPGAKLTATITDIEAE